MIPKVFAAFLLSVSTASFAEQDAEISPISSITGANWSEYESMYINSPLCEKEEVTLWMCKTPKELYSLCSSRRVTKNSGYIQYRASKNGRSMFMFPASKKPPIGNFTYHLSANGDAVMDFSTKGYEYSLVDPLRSKSLISVFAKNSPNRIFTISCMSGNQTLQVNYTLRLMYDAGVWSGYN